MRCPVPDIKLEQWFQEDGIVRNDACLWEAYAPPRTFLRAFPPISEKGRA